MKVAILSDVHGNIDALLSVLDDVKKRQCDLIVGLGDYVGYFHFPHEVVSTLMNLQNFIAIKGNHEELLFTSLHNEELKRELEKHYGKGHSIACRELLNTEMDWLKSLPSKKILNINGLNIGVFHGSPFGISDYVYPDATDAFFEEIQELRFDVVLMGHTHQQFVKCARSTLIVNPGSVGQSRDVRGLASYAILDLRNLSVRTLRIQYDKSRLIRQLLTEKNVKECLRSIGEAL